MSKSAVASHRLIPGLPRAALIVLAGDAVSALGQGMSIPFLMVYLSQVRGLELVTAGFILSAVALASFVGNPLGGWLSDRVGARAVLSAGLLCSASGIAMLAYATNAQLAFLATATLGLGNSVALPAFDALLAVLVSPEQRSGAFAVRQATLNGGLAIGAVIAGFIVDMSSVSSFQTIYLAAACANLSFVPLLLLVQASPADGSENHSGNASYRVVFRDRLFLSVVGLGALIVAVGYAQYHATFPAWATGEGGMPASALGVCFAANAVTVVLMQLPMLRILTGRSRTTAVAIGCGIWSLTWLLALAFGVVGSGWFTLVGFALTMVMFGVAETALAPTVPAIVNDLAPEHLRGRYNGVSALGWTTGFFLGPALAGFALDAQIGESLLVCLTIGCLLAALWALRIGRRLPVSANLIG